MRKVHFFSMLILFTVLTVACKAWPQPGNPDSRVISTIAGIGAQGFSGNAGPATRAMLWSPYGIAFDASGNLYLADAGSSTLRVIGANGRIGSEVGLVAKPGYSGDNGPALSAQLNFPTGVAVDAFNNVYIADSGNNAIRMFNPLRTSGVSSPFIQTVAGNGTKGYAGDGGTPGTAELNQPTGVAVDASGNLYIADSGNNVIREVTVSGAISTIAGDGTAGYSGDGGPATSAELNGPFGLALDSAGNLYIADTNNHRIRMVNSGGKITTIAGDGTSGYSGDGSPAASAELNWPTSVVLDSVGNLYIADTGNQRIRMVVPGGVISTVAGDGTYGYSGDGGPATDAQLDQPNGITLDSTGNLYIADTLNNTVRAVYSGTRPTAAAPTFTVPPGSYSSVQYVQLGDTTPDASIYYTINGNAPTASSARYSTALYIGGNNLLQAVASAPGYWNSPVAAATYDVVIPAGPAPTFSPAPGSYIGPLSVVINDAAPGATIYYTLDGSSPTTSAPLYIGPIVLSSGSATITAMATAPGSRKSTNFHGVYSVTPSTPTPVVGPTFWNWPDPWVNALFQGSPISISDADPAATIYYTLDGSTPTTASTVYAGPFLPGDAFVNYGWIQINAIAVSAGNALSQMGTQTFTAPVPVLFTIAGDGNPAYSGDGGQSTNAELNGPTGMVVDSAGDVYFSDTNNNVVRKIDPAGVISTIAGVASSNGAYSGAGGPATSERLAWPTALALDASGVLYIADTGNNRIRKVTPNGMMTTIAGTGFWTNNESPGGGQPAVKANLNSPMGVAVDGQGNIYISDTGNNLIRKVNAMGIISTVAGTGDNSIYHPEVPMPYTGGGYSGDGGPATSAALNNPEGLALDGAGNLYVADTFNNRIRMVDTEGTISTFAGNGTMPGNWFYWYCGGGYCNTFYNGCTASNYNEAVCNVGDGGAAVDAGLAYPAAITFDSYGNAFIADTWDHLIRQVYPGGTINSIAGNGIDDSYPYVWLGGYLLATGGYSGDGEPAVYPFVPGALAEPLGVAVTSHGRVLVGDTGNNRIRDVDPYTALSVDWGDDSTNPPAWAPLAPAPPY